MALGDESARSIDTAICAWSGIAIGPVGSASAWLGLADDLRAQGAHDSKAIVNFGGLNLCRRDACQGVGRTHGPVCSCWFEHVTLLVLERIHGLSPAGDLDALMLVHAEADEALFRRQNHRGVAVGNLRAVVCLE